MFLYTLVRVPIILSISEPWSDDLYRGTLAIEFLEGLRLSLWDYVGDPYGLGTLLAGLWTAPFFALFGESLFALKLAPFCWHLLSLIAWYFVFRPHFEARQAFLILLFFVLPPPQITDFMLQNNGYHFEMLLWIALSILILRSFLEGRIMASWAGILLGALGGFSSSLILTNLVTQTVIVLYLLLQKDFAHKRTFYLFYGFGFLIGFSPWLFLQAWEDGAGLKWILYFFSPDNPLLHLVKNFLRLFLKPGAGFQGLFGFRSLPNPIGILLSIAYTALYVSSLLLLLRRHRTFWKGLKGGFNLEIFGLMFQILLIALVAIERWGSSRYYYLFPLVPFVGMTIFTVFQGRLKRGLIVLCLGAGLVGNLSLIHFSDWGRSLSLPGYSYGLWSAVLEAKFGRDFPVFREKMEKVLRGRPVKVQIEFYQGLSDEVGGRLCETLPSGERATCFEGLKGETPY